MRKNKSLKGLYILLSLLLLCAVLGGCSTKNINISSDAASPAAYENAEEHIFGGDDEDIDDTEISSAHVFSGEQNSDAGSYSDGEYNSGIWENNAAENSQAGSGAAPQQAQQQSGAGAESNTAATEAQSAPIEQSDNTAPDTVPDNAQTQNTCSFLVDCSKALEYEKLSQAIRDVLPADGIIYSGIVEFTPGESVFDIMSRVLRENGIPMESSITPAFGSRYVEGINSLYEFDGGSNSGWVYFVNGSMPSHGCDLQTVNDGDDIRWYYTLNLGYDISL